MSETEPLITPELVNQLREQDETAAYEEMAESLLQHLPGAVTYSSVLKMLIAKEVTGLDLGMRWLPGTSITRLEKVACAGIEAHLGKIINLQRYQWGLDCRNDVIHLRLVGSDRWWNAHILTYLQRRQPPFRDMVIFSKPEDGYALEWTNGKGLHTVRFWPPEEDVVLVEFHAVRAEIHHEWRVPVKALTEHIVNVIEPLLQTHGLK
jgi:hypothetical protein